MNEPKNKELPKGERREAGAVTINYLDTCGLPLTSDHLCEVTFMVCSDYSAVLKAYRRATEAIEV